MQHRERPSAPGDSVEPSVPPAVTAIAIGAILLLALVGVAQFLHTEFGVGLSLIEAATAISD